MSFINTKAGEIGVKIVYFGPALAGKSTNIRYLCRKTRPALRGRMESLSDGPEPMLAFDFAPDTLPRIGRFRVRLHLVTVPGPVSYASSRRVALKGVDAIVFVADTQEQGPEIVRFGENIESMEMMLSLLDDLGVDAAAMPLVIQYNKRDLATSASPALETLPDGYQLGDDLPLDTLNEVLNPNNVPTIEAIASQGIGVFDTLRTIVRDSLEPLRQEYEAGGDRWAEASSSGRWPRA